MFTEAVAAMGYRSLCSSKPALTFRKFQSRCALEKLASFCLLCPEPNLQSEQVFLCKKTSFSSFAFYFPQLGPFVSSWTNKQSKVTLKDAVFKMVIERAKEGQWTQSRRRPECRKSLRGWFPCCPPQTVWALQAPLS